jgi:thiol-disulfide isomerase/thioredoxin
MVSRISKGAIQKLLSGKTKGPFKAVIKFYGNNCHYCHELKDQYQAISDEYDDDILFFAFNIADYLELENILNFSGVPTICFIQNNGKTPRIRVMPEPQNPHGKTWYTSEGIKNFIDKERT